MLNVLFGQATDPGKLRPNNEDAMGAFIPKSRQEAQSHGWMFVVADGVGGLDFGDVASAKVVAVMLEEFARRRRGLRFSACYPGSYSMRTRRFTMRDFTLGAVVSAWLRQSYHAPFATTRP